MGVCNVFNIERYATEDGRGIRNVVFLKNPKTAFERSCP